MTTISTGPQGQRVLSFRRTALQATQRSALEVIKKMWAPSTWQARGNLWLRYQTYCETHHMDPVADIDWAATLFSESTRATTIESTRHQYSKELSAIGTRLGLVTPVARMYQSGLRSSGALIPQNQAPAISLEQLQQLAAATSTERDGDRLLCVLFVMWKSASRYDEVANLLPRQLLEITPTRIIIYWGERTKSTRSCPFRADSWVVIDNPPAGIPPAVLVTLRSLRGEGTLCSRTTENFDRWIYSVLTKESDISAHSIKAGAVSHLIGCAAQGLIARKDMELISQVAKHKTDLPPLSDTTLRYGRNQINMAIALESWKMTLLLPW